MAHLDEMMFNPMFIWNLLSHFNQKVMSLEKDCFDRLLVKPGIQEQQTDCRDGGDCSLRYRGLPERIPGNVQQDSREC